MKVRWPQVQAVLFDAYGTVLLPQPAMVDAYVEVGRRFGGQLDRAEVAARFRLATAAEDKLDLTTYRGRTDESRERQRWERIVAAVFAEVSPIEPLFAALWQHFAEPLKWRVLPGVATTWATLAERGLTLGVASNFDARLLGICAELSPLDETPHVFASSLVGWRKPRAEFFQAIERRLQLRPEQLLLVGDDPRNDYQAAREAGWHAVLVGPATADDVEHALDRIEALPEWLGYE